MPTQVEWQSGRRYVTALKPVPPRRSAYEAFRPRIVAAADEERSGAFAICTTGRSSGWSTRS